MKPIYVPGLPQNTEVVNHLNETHTYTINASATLCFPFHLVTRWQQVVIDLALTTPFENVFVLGVRSWPSSEAAAQSITASPRQSQAYINLPPSGVKWNFYRNDLDPSLIEPADITVPIFGDTRYWMNVQNLQNKLNYFFCRFHYYGLGVESIK
jgi:hypothetical protein